MRLCEGFVTNIGDIAISMFTSVIQRVADARAENGAEQQRVQASYNLHSQNLVNLEKARGRIMDTDM
ncbi:MAG: flagellin, partial [Alphaproteobacteria bacterium]|nr:flagellin [Alphaproteobacteria bacterium]